MTATAKSQMGETPRTELDDGLWAAWINLAGRQRMLSQRIGLFLILAAEAVEAGADAGIVEARLDTLRRAVGEFAAAHRTLVDGDRARGLPPLATQRVMAEWTSGVPSARQRVETFLRDAERFAADLEARRAPAAHVRETFGAEAASDVLAVMNRITQAIEADFNDSGTSRASQRRVAADRVVASAKAIAASARYARQVSFNAKISAVRAGPYGREFSALTEELKEIADQIGISSQAIIENVQAAE